VRENARLVLVGLGTFLLAFALLTLWGLWPAIRWFWDSWDAL
jgi:hypothetical protein